MICIREEMGERKAYLAPSRPITSLLTLHHYLLQIIILPIKFQHEYGGHVQISVGRNTLTGFFSLEH